MDHAQRNRALRPGLIALALALLPCLVEAQTVPNAAASPFLNVRDFGAKGDCVTDDSDAIQRTIDAAGAGSFVVFPALDSGPGRKCYLTTRPIKVQRNNLHLFCPGDNTGYGCFVRNNTRGPILEVTASEFSMEGLTLAGNGGDNGENASIEGLLLSGDQAGEGDATLRRNTFLRLAHGIHARSRNINVVDNLFSNDLNGIFIDQLPSNLIGGQQQNRGFVIQRNRFHTIGNGPDDACIHVAKSAKAYEVQILDNFADGRGRGSFFTGAADELTIQQNTVVFIDGGVVNVNAPSESLKIDHNFFEPTHVSGRVPGDGANRSGNTVSLSTRMAHLVTKGQEVRLSGMDDPSFNGQFTTNGSDRYRLFTYPQSGKNATTGGGFYYANLKLNGDCIRVISGVTASIIGNTLVGCPQNGILMNGVGSNGAMVSGNIIQDASSAAANTYDGIHITDSVANVSVQGNQVLNSNASFARYGINSQVTGQHLIAGNQFTNSGTANVSASAASFTVSGTSVTDALKVGGGSTMNRFATYSAAITPASVTAGSCAEQSFSPAEFSGLATSDIVVVNSSSAPTALAFPVNLRAISGGVAITYCNPTTASATPTATTLRVVAFR